MDGGPASAKELDGDYLSARSIQGQVYVVTTNRLDTYQLTHSYDIFNEEIYPAGLTEAEFRAKAEDQARLVVGTFVDRLVSELGDCGSVQQITLMQNTVDPIAFSDVLGSMVNVESFSVNGLTMSTPVVRSMMLPPSSYNVFASQDYLVVAARGYNWRNSAVGEETFLMAYGLSDGTSLSTAKTGSVPGYSLNQFSFDSVDNFIRVATCTQQRWWGGANAWEPEEENLCEVNVLEIQSSSLTIVGTEAELGNAGERIYAVRFVGDRGFVVTFRETDPFYTLDMKDPRNPRKVGELKIPGFSNYLHPVGDNYVLGVGQSVEDGRRVALQVSLFDVTNFALPVRKYNLVEEQGSFSDVQYDHRGFRFLEDSGLLILPLTAHAGEDSIDGFQVYSVDERDSGGIEQYMPVPHVSGNFNGCWSYSGYLSPRSIVVDGVVRTFKAHSIAVNDLSTRTQVQTPINLDEDLEEDCTPQYFESEFWF